MLKKNARKKKPKWMRDESLAGIASPAVVDQDEVAPPPITVTPDSTLSEFFENWFLPVVLTPQQSRPGTIRVYLDVLDWWVYFTNDPPVQRIDHRLTAAFVDALRKASYRRGPKSELRRLSHNRIAILLRTLRALLGRIGPRITMSKATACLVPETPLVPAFKAVFKKKGCLTLEQARAVAAACDRMEFPRRSLPVQFPTPLWWKARLALLYYTGLRRNTAFGLRWRHVERDGDNWWLNVPASLVSKTNKATRIAVHPQLRDILKRMRCQRGEDHLLVPAACDIDCFGDYHYRLQTLAGVPEAEQISVQGWRRLHGQALAELGLAYAENVARVSLDHSDVRTTNTHYVELVNQLRLKLPPLWPNGVSEETQLTLWR